MRLIELATPQGTEMGHLDHKTDAVIEHLVKLWLFPRYRSVETWMYHTWKGIHSTSKVKKDKYLKQKDILSTTWGDNNNLVPIYLEHYIERHDKGEYKGYIRSNATDIKSLNKCMEIYFTKLSEKLSESGVVSEKEVKGFIRDSGFLKIPEG